MSSNQLPVDGDWVAVYDEIQRLMKRLDMSTARLSRESGVSESTIRYIGSPEKRQRSTLVALAAALGCPYGYLVDMLYRRAELTAMPPQAVAVASCGLERDALNRVNENLYAIIGKLDAVLRK